MSFTSHKAKYKKTRPQTELSRLVIMEKLRIKKMFENVQMQQKPYFFGPKRRVCRKLEFSTGLPSPSAKSASTSMHSFIKYKSSSSCNRKSFRGSSAADLEGVDILPPTELEENSLPTTSADGLSLFFKTDDDKLKKTCDMTSKIATVVDGSIQELSSKTSAKIVILSNELLPNNMINTRTAQKRPATPDKTSEAKLSVQEHCLYLPPISSNTLSPKNKLVTSLSQNLSDCSVSLISGSPSTSTNLINKQDTRHNSLRFRKKSYHISPINSDESDPELSDSDPTYYEGMEDGDKRRPPSLLSRRNRSFSSANSEGSADRSISPVRKTRKRKRDPASWKFNTAKRLRNSGQSYVSSKTNKRVDARTVKPPCNEKCRLKCFNKFTEQERQLFFDKFWRLNGINIQRAFIKSCMTEIKPKYKYSTTENPRKPNYAFYLKQEERKERVCKTFFVKTFDITDRMIRTVKEKCDEQDFLSEDKRGKHGHHKKIDSTLASDIKSFIASIPRIESHYTRATSSCEYISPGRTLTEIYQDFVELQKKNGRLIGKYCNFYDFFKDSGVKIHQPKKDMCDLCRDYNLTPNEDIKRQYEAHINEKNLSREEKKKDRYAIDENNICAAYDLEAILQAPHGKSSSFFYKTKMNCYNFTIAELAIKNPTEEESNKAYTNVFSYFWDETQGQKGSVEIATCVLDFLKSVNERSTSKSVNVTFYSDNCCGQNKNKYITTLYMYALQKFENIHSIRHKYLIKGHTQNENDNAHSLIEKEIQKFLKADTIYTPAQYIPLIKSAKKTGKKFEVKTMTFDDFIDIKDLQRQWGVNFTKDINRNTLSWNEIKILDFRKEEPFKFYFKTSYKDDEYREVDVRTRKFLPMVNDIELKKAYNDRFQLSENKKKDLKSLILQKAIPPYYSCYYTGLI